MAASSSERLATPAKAGTGIPRSRKKRFSTARSCEAANAREPGRTGTRVSSHATAEAGTFSNSYVTTSHSRASHANPAGSSNGARMKSASSRTGSPSEGSRNANSRPSG